MDSDKLKDHYSRISPDVYREVFEKDGHDHEIYLDDHDTLRWRSNPSVELINTMNEYDDEHLIKGGYVFDLNKFWEKWYKSGRTKNDSAIRRLYRDMGYSVHGYWEIFFWEVNNDIADEWGGDDK